MSGSRVAVGQGPTSPDVSQKTPSSPRKPAFLSRRSPRSGNASWRLKARDSGFLDQSSALRRFSCR